MGPLRLLVALGILVSSAIFLTQAAPTDILGPPRTLEGDTNVNLPESDESLNGGSENNKKDNEEVTTLERYYRVYENGTIEFKTALSNGHVQYQKISNKVVEGKTIQVYEGYVSIRFADGRYGTAYYIADENGYRRTRVETDTKPPVLPRNGPNTADSHNSTENEQEARTPVGTNVLAEEPDVSVLTTTEGNLYSEAPITEENNIKSDEDTTLSVLPSTELNLSETTPTVDSEANEEISTLPTAVDTSTDSEDDEIEASTKIEEISTDSPPLPTTTGQTLFEASTELPITQENTHKIDEDEEGSGGILPITEEVVTTITDESVSSTEPITEDNTYLTSTEVPIVEENASKSSEDLPTNTELTADIDDEYLDPITESKSSSQEEITTTKPLSLDEDINESTTLTEAPALSTTIASVTPTIDDNVGYSVGNEASTEIPVLEDENTPTEVPALPVAEQTSTTATELPALDDSKLETSTGSPSLPINKEIQIKSNEASTELPKVSTEFPALPLGEETATNNDEDGAIKRTQLPISDETLAEEDKSVEFSTEISDGIVTKTPEDNSILSEESTESALSSSSWPALPLVDNVSTELPVLENANINTTKADEVSGGDLLASEITKDVDEKDLSTLSPSTENDNSTVQPTILNNEEDSTTIAAADENLETEAKVEELPITEEGTTKTA